MEGLGGSSIVTSVVLVASLTGRVKPTPQKNDGAVVRKGESQLKV